ncbi:Catalase isozyme 2 [Hordeum vulgare]|nr:Catalase isozyme 2 [Hordeum vulgare]
MPHAGTDSSSSHSDLHRWRFAGRNKNDGRPGSVLAQRLVAAPLPLIKCDDCPRKVQRRMSTTSEHPRWVFIKCPNDGENGCDF